MGYDVLKRRCPHNQILSALEHCPECLEARRQAAIAQAGPRQPVGLETKYLRPWRARLEDRVSACERMTQERSELVGASAKPDQTYFDKALAMIEKSVSCVYVGGKALYSDRCLLTDEYFFWDEDRVFQASVPKATVVALAYMLHSNHGRILTDVKWVARDGSSLELVYEENRQPF